MPHRKIIQKEENLEQENLEQENNETIPIKEVDKLLLKQEERFNIKMTNIRSAPTPSPEELRQLKQIDRTFPNRLISMAENEQKFRHRSTYFGQIGFAIIVLGGYYLAVISELSIVGSTVAVGVSYIAYVFKNTNPKLPKSN